MTSSGHDERCIHYEGVYVSDRGEGFPFFASGIPRLSTSGSKPEDVFETVDVDFNCEILSGEAHAYLDENGVRMSARIIESFTRLLLAEQRGAVPLATDTAKTNRRRPNRRRRRAKARLWEAINTFLRDQRSVRHD